MTKTIAVDFDGVIHSYGRGWLDGTIYDSPQTGAFDALRNLMQYYAVYILTCRDPEQVKPWLQHHGFDVTTDQSCYKCRRQDLKGRGCLPCRGTGRFIFWNQVGQLLVTNFKYPAIAYIDDRGLKFENWEQTMAEVAKLY